MKPAQLPWLIAGIAAAMAISFALMLRLPLPFDGFAAAISAAIAGSLTLSLTMLAPAGWIWTDGERLRHAFAKRHGMSDQRSENVLEAITTAHARADKMRAEAAMFLPPLDSRTRLLADRLDDIAKDLFYHPGALSVHRQALVRAELIEEAVENHAKLRKRGKAQINADQIAQSRDSVDTALAALEQAFDHNETRLADRLVQQVDLSSATAETLLKRHSV